MEDVRDLGTDENICLILVTWPVFMGVAWSDKALLDADGTSC